MTDAIREAVHEYAQRRASLDEFRDSLGRAMQADAELIAELAKHYLLKLAHRNTVQVRAWALLRVMDSDEFPITCGRCSRMFHPHTIHGIAATAMRTSDVEAGNNKPIA